MTYFFEANEEEVKAVMMLEYNRADEMAAKFDEGRAEGRAEGRKEGREEGRTEGLRKGLKEGIVKSIRSLMNTMGCTADKAMDALQIPMSDRAEYLAAI